MPSLSIGHSNTWIRFRKTRRCFTSIGSGLRTSPAQRNFSRRALVQNDAMKGHECYHCKQWVEKDEPHDCWTTTEAALTKDLSEDLQDAYERLREAAVEFGEQRIYASGSCIMFSRTSCYFFVRPKRNGSNFQCSSRARASRRWSRASSRNQRSRSRTLSGSPTATGRSAADRLDEGSVRFRADRENDQAGSREEGDRREIQTRSAGEESGEAKGEG